MKFKVLILVIYIFFISINFIYGAIKDVVLDYGAVGDGINDDTGKIQDAISSLNTGDVLFFPENKTFKISSTLVVSKSNITIEFGTNSWLIADPSGTINDYDHGTTNSVFYIVNQNNISFLNVRIDGNNIPATGIYFWQCSTITFENSIIKNLKGNDSIYSNGLDLKRSHEVTINNCQFIDISNTNKSATGILLDSNPDAIDVADICTNIKISKSRFENIKSNDDADGIKFIGRLSNPLYSNSIVENCSLINCYKRAIKIQTNGVKVLNNVILNDRTSDEVGDHLIDIQGIDSVEITGNSITFNGKNPAAIGFILRNKNILIQNNDIVYDGTVGNNNKNYGIFTLCWVSANQVFEPPFWGENIRIDNVDIETVNGGELDYGIYLFTTIGGGINWEINNVNSPNSDFCITQGFSNVKLMNSTFLTIYDKTRNWSIDEGSGSKIYSDFYNYNNGIFSSNYSGIVSSLTNMDLNNCWVDGRDNFGLYLDGTNDCLNFNGNNLQLTQNKSLMLWMKINNDEEIGQGSHALYPGIFSASITGSWDNYISFYKDISYGTSHIQYEDKNGALRRSDSFNYTAGEWIHVAITMDNVRTPTFYINGIQKGIKAASEEVNLNYLGMGYAGATNDGAFPGKIDEVKILNKTLDADSILSYYKKFKFGYWNLNEINGQDRAHNFPLYFDGNHGFLRNLNTSTCWVNGKDGNGLKLDGVDGYIDFKEFDLKLTKNTSLTLWMKLTDNDVGEGSSDLYPGIFSSQSTGDWDNYISFYSPFNGSASKKCYIQYEDVNGQSRRSKFFYYATGNWVMITIIMNNDGRPSFYINGALMNATTNYTATSYVDLSYLGLGYGGATNDGAFPGIIDDVRLHEKALTLSEVQALYNNLSKRSGTDGKPSIFPNRYALYQNFPNPFNPATTINYELQNMSNVNLTIFDINGREIKTLLNRSQNAGLHSVIFNASDLASGVYIYKIKAGSFQQSRKMILLR